MCLQKASPTISSSTRCSKKNVVRNGAVAGAKEVTSWTDDILFLTDGRYMTSANYYEIRVPFCNGYSEGMFEEGTGARQTKANLLWCITTRIVLRF